MKKLIAVLSLVMSASLMAADYTCVGTEPFWGLTISGKTVAFNALFNDASTTRETIISKKDAEGTNSEYAFVVKTANATATIVTGECNDGMSDAIYEKHIMYTTPNAVLYGCCNPVK